LTGPLPAGGYAIEVDGYTADEQAKLHADLIWRAGGADGGSDTTLAQLDGTPPPPGGGVHLQPWLSGTACAGPLTAAAGDGLVLRVSYPAGTTDFILIETKLSIP
jgi:hypothetical protein